MQNLPNSSAKTPSIKRRMASWLYEGILLYAVLYISDFIFSLITQTRHGLANRHAQQVVLFLVLALYFVWFWCKGQTLPMKTWQLTVTDLHRQRLKPARAFLRYLLCWLWVIPPLLHHVFWQTSLSTFAIVLMVWIVLWANLARWMPGRQFVHDALARTQILQLN